MLLSPRHAATLVGRPPRTLRDQACRGVVPATKQGGRWTFRLEALPPDDTAQARLQRSADVLRGALEAALPPRVTGTRAKRHSVSGDRGFVALVALVEALPEGHDARSQLARAAVDLARARHRYEVAEKEAAWRAARDLLAEALVVAWMTPGLGAAGRNACVVRGSLRRFQARVQASLQAGGPGGGRLPGRWGRWGAGDAVSMQAGRGQRPAGFRFAASLASTYKMPRCGT